MGESVGMEDTRRHPEFSIQAAARVGVGFLIMLSNICVATITGFPCSLATDGHSTSENLWSNWWGSDCCVMHVLYMCDMACSYSSMEIL